MLHNLGISNQNEIEETESSVKLVTDLELLRQVVFHSYTLPCLTGGQFWDRDWRR